MASKKVAYVKGDTKVLPDNRVRKSYGVKNENGRNLTKTQIKNQFKQLQKLQEENKKEGKDFKYSIVAGLSNNQYFNIKSYNADKLSSEINNYLDGNVRDTSKFQQISHLSIIIEQ